VSHQAFPFLEQILAALTYLHRHLSPPGARPVPRTSALA
jgi:hypothetical protein